MRTGQVRVDGRRAKANQRLEAGQTVRVPPLGDLDAPKPKPERAPVAEAEAEKAEEEGALPRRRGDRARQAGRDGGPGRGQDRPAPGRDAGRAALPTPTSGRGWSTGSDRDTSGVLLLARTGAAARALTAAFRAKETVKEYWAIVVGVPKPAEGRIDLSLMKAATGKAFVPEDLADEDAKRAVTYYRIVEQAGKRAAWLALWPQTGRTHQLRVHAAAIGTPILGDGKYGGREAFLPGAEIEGRLHLHARRLVLPHPLWPKQTIDVTAPLPPQHGGHIRLSRLRPEGRGRPGAISLRRCDRPKGPFSPADDGARQRGCARRPDASFRARRPSPCTGQRATVGGGGAMLQRLWANGANRPSLVRVGAAVSISVVILILIGRRAGWRRCRRCFGWRLWCPRRPGRSPTSGCRRTG